MKKAEEKRVRERVVYIIDTNFILSDGNEISCTIQDISMSGFYMVTMQAQPEGTEGRLKIILRLGDTVKTVNAICRVARKDKRGMALTIIQIDQESSITLFNMIKFQSIK